MDESRFLRVLTCFFAFFLSLPFCIVVLAICFGPAGRTQPGAELLREWYFPLLVIVLVLSFLLHVFTLSQKTFWRFLLMLIVTTLLILTLTMGFATTVHRDFFTAIFQGLLCLPAIFLFFIWTSENQAFPKSALKTMSSMGYVLVVLYAQWIMLMGYAIATRAEPRPIESLIYNVYNLILILILFLLSSRIARKTLHTVIVGNSRVYINGRDSTTVFGPKKLSIFHAFALNIDRTVCCPAIQNLVKTKNANQALDCEQCAQNDTKATLCPGYRNTYNQVLDIKKLLEFLEIGTITSSENKREILKAGWKLKVFENVRVVVQK